jgi:hypothetical protein
MSKKKPITSEPSFKATLHFVKFSFGRSARNVVMACDKGIRYFVRLSDFETLLQTPSTPKTRTFQTSRSYCDSGGNGGQLCWDGYWLTEKKGTSYLTRPLNDNELKDGDYA